MSDAPRFRVEAGPVVTLEAHVPPDVPQALRERGHEVSVAARESLDFGSAQSFTSVMTAMSRRPILAGTGGL